MASDGHKYQSTCDICEVLRTPHSLSATTSVELDIHGTAFLTGRVDSRQCCAGVLLSSRSNIHRPRRKPRPPRKARPGIKSHDMVVEERHVGHPWPLCHLWNVLIWMVISGFQASHGAWPSYSWLHYGHAFFLKLASGVLPVETNCPFAGRTASKHSGLVYAQTKSYS